MNNGEYCLIGPLCFEGAKEDVVEYRHHSDYLHEKRGSFHENPVSNFQVDAELRQINTFGSIQRIPSQQYPETVYLNGSGYIFGWRAPNSVTVPTSGNYVATVIHPNGGFTLYKVAWTGPLNHKITSIGEYHYDFVSKTSTAVTYNTHGRSKGWLVYQSPIDCSSAPTFNQIMSWVSYLSGIAFSTNKLRTYAFINGSNALWGNELFAEAAVEYAKSRILITDSGIEARDWSDLAIAASNNFKVVKFNAIEFLADLDNPTAMIPKLQNLKNIKGIAGGYLGIHYGVLPTVDDLKSLYKSATKIKHFVDRNGFQTASAGYAASSKVDDISFSFEQHLKLAIDNEDSRMQSLVTGLENIGLMPNPSSLWDLVPYSFVIDWFVNVGDTLKDIDANQRLSRHNIRYVTSSVKETACVDVNASAFGFSGFVQTCKYHRDVSYVVPKSHISLSAPLSASDHWLEASALILQRAK